MPKRPMRTEPRAPLNYDDLFANASWMRRLAVSLVSDEALADDIVQDSFLVAIKRPPVHSNSLTGWLTAVVRSMAFRNRRQHQRRLRREIAAARPERFDAASEGALERFELQRQIADLVRDLPEPYRAVIILVYFEERSPREIAAAEGVAVTTVRSRVARAVERLKVKLDSVHPKGRNGWLLVLAPLVDSAHSAVPAAMGLGAPTSTSTFVTGGTMALTQKTVISAGIASIVVLVGVGAVSVFSSRQWSPISVPAESSTEHRQLLEELAVTKEALALARRERDAERTEKVRLRRELANLQTAAASKSEPVDTESAPEGDVSIAQTVDWSELSKLVAANLELLAKRNDQDNLSEDEKAKLTVLRGEVMKLSGLARSVNPEPLFDEGLLRGLIGALVDGPVGLSEEQSAQLDGLVESIIGDLPEDLSGLDAVENHRIRRELLLDLWTGVEGLLGPEQFENWDTVHGYAEESLRRGGLMRFGVDMEASNLLRNWLGNSIRTPPNSLPMETLRPFAEEFIQKGRAVLSDFGETNEDIRGLPKERAAELELRLLDLDRRFRETLAPYIDADKRGELFSRVPNIIRFEYGGSLSFVGGRGMF